jgi:hypothetical protein
LIFAKRKKKQKILNFFKDHGNIDKIIFCKLKIDGDVLSNYIYLNMQGMEKTKLKYDEIDFEIGFNTFNETRLNVNLLY